MSAFQFRMHDGICVVVLGNYNCLATGEDRQGKNLEKVESARTDDTKCHKKRTYQVCYICRK